MLPSLRARELPLASPREQLATLRRLSLPREFDEALGNVGLRPLRPTAIDIMQINVGKLCNQTCAHCHVDAGPDRREVMTYETMAQCVEVLKQTAIPTVDVTGGAPELNSNFRWLVEQCRALDRHVIDRCNLTVLELPSQTGLAGEPSRGGVLTATLPRAEYRCAAGRWCFRDLNQGIAAIERARLRRWALWTSPCTGYQSSGSVFAAQSTVVGRGMEERARPRIRRSVRCALHHHEYADQPVS